ncbi:hypothetical protein SRABI128_00625 [Microbacterium sp. Bi128]|nr:hypothetical protein SRABI128_00625 [Microbacterium sp. Bi128]
MFTYPHRLPEAGCAGSRANGGFSAYMICAEYGWSGSENGMRFTAATGSAGFVARRASSCCSSSSDTRAPMRSASRATVLMTTWCSVR